MQRLVLRLNYQLLGASYADEPYVGGMGGLQRRGKEEKLKRKNVLFKGERGEGEGEEILKGVWMEGWECVAAQ